MNQYCSWTKLFLPLLPLISKYFCLSSVFSLPPFIHSFLQPYNLLKWLKKNCCVVLFLAIFFVVIFFVVWFRLHSLSFTVFLVHCFPYRRKVGNLTLPFAFSCNSYPRCLCSIMQTMTIAYVYSYMHIFLKLKRALLLYSNGFEATVDNESHTFKNFETTNNKFQKSVSYFLSIFRASVTRLSNINNRIPMNFRIEKSFWDDIKMLLRFNILRFSRKLSFLFIVVWNLYLIAKFWVRRAKVLAME